MRVWFLRGAKRYLLGMPSRTTERLQDGIGGAGSCVRFPIQELRYDDECGRGSVWKFRYGSYPHAGESPTRPQHAGDLNDHPPVSAVGDVARHDRRSSVGRANVLARNPDTCGHEGRGRPPTTGAEHDIDGPEIIGVGPEDQGRRGDDPGSPGSKGDGRLICGHDPAAAIYRPERQVASSEPPPCVGIGDDGRGAHHAALADVADVPDVDVGGAPRRRTRSRPMRGGLGRMKGAGTHSTRHARGVRGGSRGFRAPRNPH
jgi:hypothetical protein